MAPLFALINNVIEIRVDAYKYVTTLRRPLAQRVENIGAWANILQTLTYISVFTNVSTYVFVYLSTNMFAHTLHIHYLNRSTHKKHNVI